MDNKTKVRNWDIAKGIAILSLLMGNIDGIPPLMKAIIFSFSIPLLFAASDYCREKYDIKDTLIRSSKCLLAPYLAVCLISACIAAYRNGDIETNIFVLRDKLYDMFAGMSEIKGVFENLNTVWLAWIIICLFLARLIYVLVMQLTKKLPWFVSLIVIIVLSATGIIISNKIGFLPWSADIALLSTIFMWACDNSKHVIDFSKRFKFSLLIASLIVITLIPVWIYLVCKDHWSDLASRNYARDPLCVITALLGIFVVLILSMALDKLKYIGSAISWFGKNSLIILIIHCLESRFFDWEKYIYPHMPCFISGMWYREMIVKVFFILLVSASVAGIKRLCDMNEYDNK